jgi:hypothetical protein
LNRNLNDRLNGLETKRSTLFWSKAKIKKVSAPNSTANNSTANKKRDGILDIAKIAKALSNAMIRPNI